jgi:polyhydroxyalkanoate synthesis regulator phasin
VLDELRRMALITSGVAELTRSKAEKVVKDLVKAGDVRRDHASGLVKELMKRSSENRAELTRFVSSEIRNQVEKLGLASTRDLERLERRITRLENNAKGSKSPSKPSPKKSTAKKATAKKTSARAANKAPSDGS